MTTTTGALGFLAQLGAAPAEPESGQANPAPASTDALLSQPGAAGAAATAPLPTEAGAALAARLRAAGHRILTSDGRLFTSESSRLTDALRSEIKTEKASLLLLAEPWTPTPEAMVKPAPTTATTLAQFLGNEMPRLQSDWCAQEPPTLDGIDEIILNVETNGLDWAHGDLPIGITVGTLDQKLVRFLPFGFRDGNLDKSTVLRWAQRALRGKRITNANTRFDVHMMREFGVDLEEQGCTVSDVQHYAALLDDHRKKFGIDVLAKDMLGGITVPRVDERQMTYYTAAEVAARAEYQVKLVAQLRDVMWPQLDAQDLQRVRQLEDEVIFPVVEMEKNGSLIDLELLEQYQAESLTLYQQLMREIADEVGFQFEHTGAGWQRLFEHLHLPPTDSHAENIIGAIDHPTVKKAHFADQVASLNSKTFAAYRKQIGSDGILRYDIHQLRGDDGGTVSGRFSIGYVQQVPNQDNHFATFGDRWFPRRLFKPATGQYLEGDANQIEYRLLAHLAENPQILKAYQDDPTISYHKMTWGMMKQYKPDMLYTNQKSFNFAKQYGAKSIKLAVMLGFITEAEGNWIRENKAWNDPRLKTIHEIESAYTRMMPEGDFLLEKAAHLAKPACDKYCKTNDEMHRRFKHRGYVKTLLGRRSRFPNGFKNYIGLNRVLQGTGADIMKMKTVLLHKMRKVTGLLLRLTVHDAVGGDAQTPETLSLVSDLLNEQAMDLKVKILWSVQTGANWAECK
jgi:DNA polymerase I-like protein with 3'-5' exonuclease and polymerase domains